MTSENGYKVGYCNPPLHTRFQPGVSGHSQGRPRRRSDESPIERGLARTTTVTIAGRRKKVLITEVLIMQLQQEALAGDKAARRDLLRIAVEYDRIHLVASKDLPQAPMQQLVFVARRPAKPVEQIFCSPSEDGGDIG